MNYLDLENELQKVEYKDNQNKIELLNFTSENQLTITKNLQKLKELYNCINLNQNYNFSNFEDDDMFFFRYFPKIPHRDDERYKTIKKYACKFNASNKTDKFCTEQYNCLIFELAARVPKNVQAVEEAVALYEKNESQLHLFYDLVFYKDIALEKNNREKLTKEEESELFLIASQLNDKVKNLQLVRYQYYSYERDKFQHWSINHKIYEIVNLMVECFSLPVKEEVNVIGETDTETLQFKTKKSYYYDIDRSNQSNHEGYYFQNDNHFIKTINFTQTYYLEHINKLNDFSYLVQSIPLAKPFDLGFMNYEDNLAYFNLHSGNMTKTLLPIYYYPDISSESMVNVQINASSGNTNAIELFDKLYTSLKGSKKLELANETRIFDTLFFYNKTGTAIAEDLFYYDYFYYREEQQKHIVEYLNHILQLKPATFKKVFKKNTDKATRNEMIQEDSEILEDAIRKKIKIIKDTLQKNQ
ncbi:hypothetical protein GJV85_03465 [Sulfurimonas aquatica]|uniref:Uncharacterized protein n=1 Tax=Sulfurimonas aquatica TaxID=2672570 RepID=A0A975AZ76_9BACT|nr:hypothetical protein [Sulfurimonas aquatica]QSZ41208.1 hypothetical protein GJV85_03465 [Sulfurimonas aquatica]